MVASLVANVKMMESDPGVRVIVLTGSGESFCTGMDLNLSPDQATHENMAVRAAKGVEMFETVSLFSPPLPFYLYIIFTFTFVFIFIFIIYIFN